MTFGTSVLDAIPTIANATNILWVLSFDPFPSKLYAHHTKTNVLGSVNKNGTPFLVALFDVRWKDETDNDMIALAQSSI